MLTPTVHATARPFYAVGNTPAISLTAALPQGVDADILLLGCGDARHILYTCYAERGFPKRKLDITACDIEENIIARNILVLSLIMDGAETASSERIWNIYYHLYLDGVEMNLLANQAKKLLGLSETLGRWHASTYGSILRFCDQDTLRLVRKVWSRYSESVQAKDTPQYKTGFESARKASQVYKEKAWGKQGIVFTSARATAPLYLQMSAKLTEATNRHWQTGLSSPKPPGNAMSPNPMFAVAISDTLPLAHPSDPLLSFHLAFSHAKLTELSPLRLVNQTKDKIYEAAQLLFKEWTAAFRDAAPSMVIRFVAADCFSFCHTLQHNAETSKTTANWYRRETGFKVLTLATTEYGDGGNAPKHFDVIDTSNISDYNGALSLLISAGPLLKNRPWSTLHTELMARGSASESSKFESLLCGHTRTISILLGLAPIEYWTNATAVSAVDEIMISMTDRSKVDGLRIQSRLAWKLDNYLAGKSVQASKLSVKPEDLAILAHRVYLDMFQHENLAKYQSDMFAAAMVKRPAPQYHRGSFAAFVKTLCKTTRTNPTEFGRLILEKVVNDTTLMLGSNYSQAFCLELSEIGVFSEPGLRGEIQRNNTQASFCKWKHIPEKVAVTLVIPTSRWQQGYKTAREQTAGLTLEGSLRCDTPGDGGYHNIFPDVQIGFGTITTRGSRDHDDFTVVVKEDEDGWTGNSPMIATFYVATGALQFYLPGTRAGLSLQSSPQNIMTFASLLGQYLNIFDAKVLDENHVFISRHAPGQDAYHVVSSGLPPPARLQDLAIGNASREATFTADIHPSSGEITTITGHMGITTDKGKKFLADKVPIELQQSSPFTIDIVFGKRALVLPLIFSVPVLKDNSKTRIARKSCYIEVIAPVAAPLASPYLEDYIFPTVPSSSCIPATLNIPHLNLDSLPILAIDDKDAIRFLTPFSSFLFSARERLLREEADKPSGLTPSARLNFKESLFTMLMLSSGVQGGQTGLFAISHPRDGIHMLLFVSAIRLDGAGAGVVLDAAVLPFTRDMLENHLLDEFLLLIRTLECCTLTVDDAELKLWKRVLPALAERCRTWEHGTKCEYHRKGEIPVSQENGEQVLCSCGLGRFPENYVPLPEWDSAAKFATRVAISPVFASPFVEDVVDTKLTGMMAQRLGNHSASGGVDANAGDLMAAEEACRACGRADAKPNGGPLKKCARCLKVKYCSAECQKQDWKKHRMECEESEVYGGR